MKLILLYELILPVGKQSHHLSFFLEAQEFLQKCHLSHATEVNLGGWLLLEPGPSFLARPVFYQNCSVY